LCRDRQVFKHAHHHDEVRQNLVSRLYTLADPGEDQQAEGGLTHWEVDV
jgi:hypothetical protein